MKQFYWFIACVLWCLVFSFTARAQYSLKGRVRDAKTREYLAFVNIVFDQNPYKGIVSDIDGRFTYTSVEKMHTLTFSYIGYKTLHVNLDSLADWDKLLINLSPTDLTLQEVVIKAGENPANRIIRQVIANKTFNDPENVEAFAYTSYNKTVCYFRSNDSLLKTDTLQLEIDSVLKGGHLLMMESVTKRKYLAPDKSEETVIGTKVSGFKHPSFAPIATDLQPFSFYKEVISIFDINYLNPIAGGSLSKYQFTLKDTLYQDKDTVFVISFKPRSGKNFDGLMGLLYINTNLFAVQNVIAEPFEKGFIDIKIQQQYTFLENKQWFPKQLNFELKIKKYPSPKFGMYMNGKSYIDKVDLQANLKRSDFSQASLVLDEKASERDSVFWNANRSEVLDKSETITYRVIDSLGEKNKFEKLLRIMEKLAQNKIPVKFLDIDLTKTFVNNKFEGQRIGLGVYTNERVFKHVNFGGYFGYGLKDKQWKYGGDFTLEIQKSKEMELKGFYQNTLGEAGSLVPNYLVKPNFGWRNFISARMDRIDQKGASFGFRTLRYLKVGISTSHLQVSPQYNYTFQPQSDVSIHTYTNAELRLNLRYAYKERIIESFNTRMLEGSKFPVLSLSCSRGIKAFYGSQFEYTKLEARLDETVFIKNLGQTRLSIQGGYIDKPLPYGLLFTGEGGYDKNFYYILRNYFQALAPYEFLSDKYVNVFFTHSFGSLLFKTDKFKPKLSLQHNMGWGMLSHPEYHEGIDFTSKDKGYYESGIILDDLLRLNYLNIAYIGVGGGIFCRYGPYAHKNTADNFVYKISLTFSTK